MLSFCALTALCCCCGPFKSVDALTLLFSDMHGVITRQTPNAAAPYRVDLIKCCSTLTGLSEPTHLCLAPAGSWVALGVMHENRNRTKCFLKNIHTSRRREAKATSVHTDDQWALCLEVVKHGDVAAVLQSNNRREHGSSQWSCFSRLRGFF